MSTNQKFYWAFAQFIRFCLLPIVIPVRLYEMIKGANNETSVSSL